MCVYTRAHVCVLLCACARVDRFVCTHVCNENFQDAPHGSAIFIRIFKMLRKGARFSSKFSGRSARERGFDQKRTILSGSVWYRAVIEIVPQTIRI